ncbi:MAG: hypothetical protein ACLFQH_08385 [Halothiobacillaceae bacterium]
MKSNNLIAAVRQTMHHSGRVLGLCLLLACISLVPKMALAEEEPNLLRFWVTLGPGQPVAHADVAITNRFGAVLLTGRTSGTGQLVFYTARTLPDELWVRVTGGQSNAVAADAIDLRAVFYRGTSQVVNINPLTTIQAAYSYYHPWVPDLQEYEDIQYYLDLPDGIDHAQMARLTVSHFDGEYFAKQAVEQGQTTWQLASEVAAEAILGRDARALGWGVSKQKTLRFKGQSVVTDRGQHLDGRSASTRAITATGLLTASVNGIAGSTASDLFGKMMFSAGLYTPPEEKLKQYFGDKLGQIEESVSALRASIDEISSQVVASQRMILDVQAGVDRIFYQINDNEFRNQLSGFQESRNALKDILDSFNYFQTYLSCVEKGGSQANCDVSNYRNESLAGNLAPGIDVCPSADLGEGHASHSARAQCVFLINKIHRYVSGKTPDTAKASLIGIPRGAGVPVDNPGLLQRSQDVYARTVKNGLLNQESHQQMKRMGEYWLALLEQEQFIWLLAAQDRRVLPNSLAISEVNRAVVGNEGVIREQVRRDTSGLYFPADLPSGCQVILDYNENRLYFKTNNVRHHLQNTMTQDLVGSGCRFPMSQVEGISLEQFKGVNRSNDIGSRVAAELFGSSRFGLTCEHIEMGNFFRAAHGQYPGGQGNVLACRGGYASGGRFVEDATAICYGAFSATVPFLTVSVHNNFKDGYVGVTAVHDQRHTMRSCSELTWSPPVGAFSDKCCFRKAQSFWEKLTGSWYVNKSMRNHWGGQVTGPMHLTGGGHVSGAVYQYLKMADGASLSAPVNLSSGDRQRLMRSISSHSGQYRLRM